MSERLCLFAFACVGTGVKWAREWERGKIVSVIMKETVLLSVNEIEKVLWVCFEQRQREREREIKVNHAEDLGRNIDGQIKVNRRQSVDK